MTGGKMTGGELNGLACQDLNVRIRAGRSQMKLTHLCIVSGCVMRYGHLSTGWRIASVSLGMG